MGGYVAGPPVLAALLRGVPVVVMEPNAVPGFTNRHIARWVKRALISFEETARFFPKGRTELTGLPVRRGPSRRSESGRPVSAPARESGSAEEPSATEPSTEAEGVSR